VSFVLLELNKHAVLGKCEKRGIVYVNTLLKIVFGLERSGVLPAAII
jgi:hypothetical protein